MGPMRVFLACSYLNERVCVSNIRVGPGCYGVNRPPLVAFCAKCLTSVCLGLCKTAACVCSVVWTLFLCVQSESLNLLTERECLCLSVCPLTGFMEGCLDAEMSMATGHVEKQARRHITKAVVHVVKQGGVCLSQSHCSGRAGQISCFCAGNRQVCHLER